jgi:hypothetical protein
MPRLLSIAVSSAQPCTCQECRALDREHPLEGIQLLLLPELAPRRSARRSASGAAP